MIALAYGPNVCRMANGPYARISFLQPHDGKTVDFEAGYIRHLDWHRQAKDPWTWFGWTVWTGERQRWLVYATFGHSAAELDSPVSPVDDERDNVSNVTPHGHFAGHSLYEFLPALSNGDGVPHATPRVEFTTVDLAPGGEKAFESSIERSDGESLWYRLIAGGAVPRYVRLRPRPNLTAILELKRDLPAKIEKATVEILNLRPPMSYGL